MIGVSNDDVVFGGVELEPFVVFENLGRMVELVRGASAEGSICCLCPHC